MAERMGKYLLPSFNCNAPDTGNMEVLYHFGNDAQKEKWLTIAGRRNTLSVWYDRADVASSDATNMAATIIEDGDDVSLMVKSGGRIG